MQDQDRWRYQAIADTYKSGRVTIYYTRGLETTGPTRATPPGANRVKQILDYDTGQCEQYYTTGALMGIGTHESGVKEGEWWYYFQSGDVRSHGKYRKGIKQGQWVEHGKDGMTRYVPFKNGVIDGIWQEEDAYGVPTKCGRYKQGKPQGLWRIHGRPVVFINGAEYSRALYTSVTPRDPACRQDPDFARNKVSLLARTGAAMSWLKTFYTLN